MFADEPVSVHCCFAAVSRGGDSLSISEISYISSREYSRHICFSFMTCDNVTSRVEVDLSFEYRSVRFVADRHKHTICLEKLFLSSLQVSAPNSRHVAVSQYFFHDRIPDEFYLRIL